MSVEICDRADCNTEVLGVGTEQLADVRRLLGRWRERRARRRWPGRQAAAKARYMPSGLGVLVDQAQRRHRREDREVKRVDVHAQVVVELDRCAGGDPRATALVPRFKQPGAQRVRLAQQLGQLRAGALRRNEDVALRYRQRAAMGMHHELGDLRPDVARSQPMVVVLALVVVPRAVAVSQVGNDVTTQVAGPAVLLDGLVPRAQRVGPFEHELLPLAGVEQLQPVDRRHRQPNHHVGARRHRCRRCGKRRGRRDAGGHARRPIIAPQTNWSRPPTRSPMSVNKRNQAVAAETTRAPKGGAGEEISGGSGSGLLSRMTTKARVCGPFGGIAGAGFEPATFGL